MVFRQKQLGFNAVRLPMTFSDLNLAPKMWTKPCIDDTASLKVRLHMFCLALEGSRWPTSTPLGACD